MENTQDQSPSGNEQLIANQWIDYLKRKNTQLTFLWVFFLLLGILTSGLAAWSFWQKQESKESLLISQASLADIKAANALLTQDKEALSLQLIESKNALTEANNLVASLQNSHGETGSQLDLTTRIVAALKQKIESLESDNTLLEEALVASEAKAKETSRTQQKVQQTVQELRDSIKARKSAYEALAKRQLETQEEMQRLATALNESKEREANLDQRNARLSKELKSSIAQLKKVDEEKSLLSAKLKTLTMPIQGVRPSKSVAPSPSSREAAMMKGPEVKTLGQLCTCRYRRRECDRRTKD